MPTTSVTSTSEDESGASSVRSPTSSVHTVHSPTGYHPPPALFGPPPPHVQRARPGWGGGVISQHQTLGRPPPIPSSTARIPYGRPLDYQPPHGYRSPPIQTSQVEPSSPASHALQDPSLAYDLLPELPPPQLPEVPTPHDRWERLAVLFRSVHAHALTFDYPNDSVSALESMLVRLYLESPLVGSILRDEGANMGEMGMGALGDAELGIPSIGSGIHQLGDLDTMGIMDGVGIPSTHQDAQPQPHPHRHLHHH
ncbi:hypothetical protein FS749_006802 [Ceratobasidium sp. UAMH 11750]|nr:hypothetical protein FS749_006802 [Ceratobasidium sp. UAMH 11750]